MDLYSKILELKPNLTSDDFQPETGTILLRDDGNGAYIKSWNHPSETQPTAEELA
jgi:hypothetical protein